MSTPPVPPMPRRWPTAIGVLLLLAIFCTALLFVNATAENVPGRRVETIAFAPTPSAPFATVRLPTWHCCSTESMRFRTTLDAETAAARQPAVLIVSAHDNARLFINGELVSGEGPSTGDPTNWSRRPRMLRIPKHMAAEGTSIEIEVQRGVGFGHLRPFYMGEYDALYPSYVALRVLRADMHVATGIVGAFVAALCIAAASLLGFTGLMYSLGGLAASWALQVAGLSPSDPPWNGAVSNGIYFVGYLGTVVFLLWFFVEWTSIFAASAQHMAGRFSFITRPWSRRSRDLLAAAILGTIALGAIAIALTLANNPALGSQNVDRVIGFMGLGTIAFCLVRVGAFYLRSGIRDPLEASAFVFVLVAAIADIIMVRFFFIYGVSLGAAVMFFPLALLLSLAARARGVFEAATANAEKLNALVSARESEIVANHEEIRRNERAAMLLEERSRIMRDMHDGIGGQLIGLILQARSKKLSGEALVAGLEQSLDDLRMVVDSLEQGEGSLTGALGAFRARIEPRCEAAGVELVWEIDDVGETPGIGPDKTLQIYRVLLEACTNALKHSCATRLTVSLKRRGEAIEIAVADNGKGFEVATASGGRGLPNMQARAHRMGATLTVGSAPGTTIVTLALPA